MPKEGNVFHSPATVTHGGHRMMTSEKTCLSPVFGSCSPLGTPLAPMILRWTDSWLVESPLRSGAVLPPVYAKGILCPCPQPRSL